MDKQGNNASERLDILYKLIKNRYTHTYDELDEENKCKVSEYIKEKAKLVISKTKEPANSLTNSLVIKDIKSKLLFLQPSDGGVVILSRNVTLY